MDENTDLPDEDRGLYLKYRVVKIDSSNPSEIDGPIGIVHGLMHKLLPEVTDPVFVMKYDDPAAQDALWVYANSVKAKYPKLAEDIKEQITQAIERSQAAIRYGVWNIVEGHAIVVPCNSWNAAAGMINDIGEGEIVYQEPGQSDWTFENPKVIEERND